MSILKLFNVRQKWAQRGCDLVLRAAAGASESSHRQTLSHLLTANSIEKTKINQRGRECFQFKRACCFCTFTDVAKSLSPRFKIEHLLLLHFLFLPLYNMIRFKFTIIKIIYIYTKKKKVLVAIFD